MTLTPSLPYSKPEWTLQLGWQAGESFCNPGTPADSFHQATVLAISWGDTNIVKSSDEQEGQGGFSPHFILARSEVPKCGHLFQIANNLSQDWMEQESISPGTPGRCRVTGKCSSWWVCSSKAPLPILLTTLGLGISIIYLSLLFILLFIPSHCMPYSSKSLFLSHSRA